MMPTDSARAWRLGFSPDPALSPVSRSSGPEGWADVVVGATAFQGLTYCIETYGPPDTSRKSFTRATLMK
jgi:hypothetical protein